jgi:hypothetical protein
VSGAGRFTACSCAFGANVDQVDASWDQAWVKLKEFEAAMPEAPSRAARTQFVTGEIVIGFHALDFALYSQDRHASASIKTVLLEDGVRRAPLLRIPEHSG